MNKAVDIPFVVSVDRNSQENPLKTEKQPIRRNLQKDEDQKIIHLKILCYGNYVKSMRL